MTTHHLRRARLALLRLETRTAPAGLIGAARLNAISTWLPGPTLSFASAQAVATEEQGAAVLTVVLSQPAAYRVDVPYVTDAPTDPSAATPGREVQVSMRVSF